MRVFSESFDTFVGSACIHFVLFRALGRFETRLFDGASHGCRAHRNIGFVFGGGAERLFHLRAILRSGEGPKVHVRAATVPNHILTNIRLLSLKESNPKTQLNSIITVTPEFSPSSY